MHRMRDARITQARAAIRIAGGDLEDGQTVRLCCPFCEGGRSKEESFYVTRQQDAVLYVCHRASCGKRGRLGLLGYAGVHAEPSITRVPLPKPFEQNLVAELPPRWQAKYDAACCGEFKRAAVSVGLHGVQDFPDTVAWILRDVDRHRIGVQTRRDVGHRKIVTSYKETSGSLYSYYCGIGRNPPVWIVEDCLSAAAVQSHGRDAVALLGTHLHADVRDAITRTPTRGFIVALDPGAEKDAALVRERLSCYTTRPVHVLYMAKDIKNMNAQEQFDTIHVRGRL